MDPSATMPSAPAQTLPFPSSCSSPSSRSSPTSPASHSFELIETHYPTFLQIIDCATLSSSSQPMPFRANASSSSTTVEPKLEYLLDVSNNSLRFPYPSGKSLPHASLVVEIPRPLESLQSSSILPFLSKTYEIVNDPSLDRVISWSPGGQSFVVWDPVEFSKIVLPRHFKHSNFSSFVRQLNTYTLLRTAVHFDNAMFLLCFRKIDGDRWEFANEEFLRGKRGLLKNINRRRSPRTQPKNPYLGSSVRMELLGAEDELQKLRSKKQMLMQEIVKMKQENLVTIKEVDKLNCRLQSAELRQKQMMSFWAKVLQNPAFLKQLKQAKKLRELASTRSIKRSLEQEQPNNTYVNNSTAQQIVEYRQSFCQPGSTFVLQGLESRSEALLTDHLLQDMSDKLGLDVNVQDGISNKQLEISEPSFSQNATLKGTSILVSKEFSANTMVLEPNSFISESSTQPDLQIDTFNGKNAEEIQDVFLYSVKPEDEIACKEEFFDVDFEGGGSLTSDYDVWDNFFCTNPVIPGDEIGFSEMWDYGLHSDEGFDIDKCFGSEVHLLPDMDEDGLKDDHPKSSEF